MLYSSEACVPLLASALVHPLTFNLFAYFFLLLKTVEFTLSAVGVVYHSCSGWLSVLSLLSLFHNEPTAACEHSADV